MLNTILVIAILVFVIDTYKPNLIVIAIALLVGLLGILVNSYYLIGFITFLTCYSGYRYFSYDSNR